jgi:hypothetical protein
MVADVGIDFGSSIFDNVGIVCSNNADLVTDVEFHCLVTFVSFYYNLSAQVLLHKWADCDLSENAEFRIV